MKRVIDGKSYNTDTAEVIAETEGTYEKRQGEEWRYYTVLYRTPKGAWFTVETEWLDDGTPEDERDERVTFAALNLDEALEWVKQYPCTLHNESYFPRADYAGWGSPPSMTKANPR